MQELNIAGLEPKTYKKEILNAAKMAQLLFVPDTPEAKSFVEDLVNLTMAHEDQVAPRKRMRKATAIKTFREAVAAFSADLIHHSAFEPSEGFCYRSANREAMADTMVSTDNFGMLVNWWQCLGLLEATGSIQVKETWDGTSLNSSFYAKSRRFRPTPMLLDLAAKHGISPESVKVHFRMEVGKASPVTVRNERLGSNGRDTKPANIPARILKQNPKYETEISKVKLLNANLAKAGFDLQGPPQLYRLFSRGNLPGFDFNMGGRLYCGSDDNWQRWPSDVREKITCRGKPTVEIDVRASHLFILYALNNLQLHPNQDPYRLPNVDRPVVKGLFAAITGKGELPTRWPQGLSESYKAETGRALKETYNFKTVLRDLLELHPVLRTIKKGKLDWARLQYEEAECFMWAMRNLWNPFKVGALPVHDSLIVASEDKDIATDFLGQAYENRFGSRPFIRAK